MDKGAAKAEGGTPAPRGVEARMRPCHWLGFVFCQNSLTTCYFYYYYYYVIVVVIIMLLCKVRFSNTVINEHYK